MVKPLRRAADRGPAAATLERRRHQREERLGRLPALQPQEGQPVAGRKRHAPHPRADPPEVRVLDAHAEAPTRALAAGFVAEVSRRGTDAVVTTRPAAFRLSPEYKPRGDQPRALENHTRIVVDRRRHTVQLRA